MIYVVLTTLSTVSITVVIERKGIYSNISEINKNKQYILYVLPLI